MKPVNKYLNAFRAANQAAESSLTAKVTPSIPTSDCPAGDTTRQSKVIRAYFARKVITHTGKGKSRISVINFRLIGEAVIGYTVYIVVETCDFDSGDVVIELRGGRNTSFVAPDETASFKVEGKSQSQIKVAIGNWASQREFSNSASLKSFAIAEIELKAGSDTATKEWIQAIGQTEDKRAFLQLHITSTGGSNTLYYSDSGNDQLPNSEKSIFCGIEYRWFELYACLCSKELSILDLEHLGISAANAERFQTGLACIGDTYGINSCIRISQFLAQLRHESSDFYYTKEIWGPSDAQLNYEGNLDLGNTIAGDGRKFQGRGLIQITGRANYTAYGVFVNTDFLTGSNNERLEHPNFAADSAGWYYSRYLDVDLNTFADSNDLIYITYRINGGFTGYRQREEILASMIAMMIGCRSAELPSASIVHDLESSEAWTKPDAIYKWANLIYSEDGDASAYYQRYLDKTDAHTRNSKIKQRRQVAASRINLKASKQ